MTKRVLYGKNLLPNQSIPPLSRLPRSHWQLVRRCLILKVMLLKRENVLKMSVSHSSMRNEKFEQHLPVFNADIIHPCVRQTR